MTLYMQEILLSQHPTQLTITVKKTDDVSTKLQSSLILLMIYPLLSEQLLMKILLGIC